jgi:hypothetical protein
LQERVFSVCSDWGTFIEEDILLKPNYLMELNNLIDIVDDHSEVVKVSCFQIVSFLNKLPRGYRGFYPGTGTKAFAERKEFFSLKQDLMAKYISLVKDQLNSVEQFFNIRNAALLAADGYFIAYFQKDSLIESFLHFQNKLHVTTMPDLATDIGINGMHNYTTEPIQIDINKKLEKPIYLIVRKKEFENSIDKIVIEARENIIRNFQKILEGFYISRSRKSMLKEVLISTFRKVTRFLKGIFA